MFIVRTSLVLIALLRGASVLAAEPTFGDEAVVSDDGNHFSQRFSRGKDVIVVDVRGQRFDQTKHKLTTDDSGGVRKVDGRRVLGTDAGPPESLKLELASVQVSWNGTTHRLPKRFYADCFNAPATPRILVSDGFRSVMISISGGDGAGAYSVTWTVSQTGVVTRFLAEIGNLQHSP